MTQCDLNFEEEMKRLITKHVCLMFITPLSKQYRSHLNHKKLLDIVKTRSSNSLDTHQEAKGQQKEYYRKQYKVDKSQEDKKINGRITSQLLKLQGQQMTMIPGDRQSFTRAPTAFLAVAQGQHSCLPRKEPGFNYGL